MEAEIFESFAQGIDSRLRIESQPIFFELFLNRGKKHLQLPFVLMDDDSIIHIPRIIFHPEGFLDDPVHPVKIKKPEALACLISDGKTSILILLFMIGLDEKEEIGKDILIKDNTGEFLLQHLMGDSRKIMMDIIFCTASILLISPISNSLSFVIIIYARCIPRILIIVMLNYDKERERKKELVIYNFSLTFPLLFSILFLSVSIEEVFYVFNLFIYILLGNHFYGNHDRFLLCLLLPKRSFR